MLLKVVEHDYNQALGEILRQSNYKYTNNV